MFLNIYLIKLNLILKKSYVGSEESIANRLEKKLAELKKEADAITTVGSLQIQYLLLRWCFCQKIIHLQRTIPPNLFGIYLVLCHATYSDISCTILYIMCIYMIYNDTT